MTALTRFLPLSVWKFTDGECFAHVIATDEESATRVFDARMGAAFREEMATEPVEGERAILIAEGDDMYDFTERTADEWIESRGKECFL